MTQISKRSYGNYSTSNYGAHCMVIDVGRVRLYFSYDTVVAFSDGCGLVICENDWGPTTGKHLNWINDDKSKRIPSGEFEKKLAKLLKKYNLEA